jgi:thiamine monophosphate synthase
MKKYLITSHDYHSDSQKLFVQKLELQFLKYKPDYALFRDEQTDAYVSLAQEFVSLCKKHGVQSFLHKDKVLAELGACVHLKSSQFVSPGDGYDV